jgi:hypothetical protein
MNLLDVLQSDAKNPRLTKKERKAIKDAYHELIKLRAIVANKK